MPRKPKGPRLYLRNDEGGKRWIIRDRNRDTRTGLKEGQETEAAAMLDHYIAGQFASKYRADRGVIYFVTCLNSENYPVKIGYSNSSAEARMVNIQNGNPNLLNVIGTFPGSITDERKLHERFAHLRIRGEWFVRAQEIIDYVGGLPGQRTVFGVEEFDGRTSILMQCTGTTAPPRPQE